MAVQEVNAPPNPFEAYRRKTRLQAVAIVSVIVVGIAATKGYFVFKDPLRVLRTHRTELEAQRDQFCRVLAAEKARGTRAVPVASGDAVDTSSTSLYSKPASYDRPPGNADVIEMPQLEELCKGERVSGGTLTNALLPELLNEQAAERYDRLGYEAGVALAARSKFLVVVNVDTFSQNIATGNGSMDSGKFAAHASLYSLTDATCLGTIETSGRGPGYVSVMTFTTLGSRENQVDSSLRYESKRRALETIGETFTKNGRSVALVQKF